ncbi:MAG: inositol 2-dehydrogenase [candidate division KSB1 bacterium]|nr:inositol 2-dehydrogenase [candidate division KSB1 bacterium]
MRPVTLGVIGAGRIGKLHAENILRMPDARLKLIADPYIDENWARSLGLNFTLSPDAIFADAEIEGVLILSPSPLHADQIIEAARAGKHIFCEKPIALDPDRIVKALEVVQQEGVKLQVGFNRRFDPDFKRLKQAVAAGDIGRIYVIKITARDPKPPSIEYVKNSGGIFLDMTIHDFDMVRYLSDSEVEEVYATGAVLIDPAIGEAGDVDTAITTLKLKNGALAVIDNSRQAVYGYDQRIEVFGSKGSIAAMNRTPTQTVRFSPEGVISDKPLYFFLERYRESFINEIEEFIQVIREDREPPVGGYDGLVSTLIGLAAKKSLAEGKPIRVEKLASEMGNVKYQNPIDI